MFVGLLFIGFVYEVVVFGFIYGFYGRSIFVCVFNGFCGFDAEY